MNDLRFALRQLHKSPGFTAIAVLTLALGIGANTAIFSVVNAVLLRPLPYPHPERLVYLNETGNGTDVSIALPDYVDWRKDSKSFQHLALTRLESRNLSGIAGREPERIAVAFVTANFFEVIGLPAQIGRTFREDEDKPGAPALVILSDRLWDRAFHRDPEIVGRAVNFHGQPSTVIGVMPREMDSPHGVDAWFSVMRRSANPGWQNRANHPMFFAWGRMKEGMALEQVRSEIIRQLLIESFAISAIGGGLGLVFAIWGRDALVAFAPAGAPRFEGIGFDWRVMAFTFSLAALTTVLFGLWPAWQAASGDIQAALQAGSFGSSETKAARRSRDWLVIIEG